MQKHIDDQKLANQGVTLDGVKKWLRQDLLSINSLVVTLIKDDELRALVAEKMYQNFLADEIKRKTDDRQAAKSL